MLTILNEDAARRWTDAELEALERNMRREYQQAAREMRGKQAEWLKQFEREREMREKALDNTREAMDAHRAWLESQATRSAWLDGMVGGLSDAAHNANVRATAMVNDHIPRVFTENANRAAFAIEGNVGRDMGFTLVSEDAVRYLMGMPLHGGGGGQLVKEVVDEAAKLGPGFAQSVRKRELDYPKDMRWNRQKFTSAITQGILQGESVPNIVKRTESVFGQNLNAATRAARTATTNAENAGRMSSFERAERLGIDMEIEWQATLDERTRESHRELDGQRVKVGESFETEDGPIRWPGDPQADPAQVWNCRCRADGRVVGFDGKRGDWADDGPGERWARLPDGMTYEQWKSAKAVSRDLSYENEAGMVSGAWMTEQAAEAAAASVVDASAAVWQGDGAQALPHAEELLEAAPQEARAVWCAYESELRLLDGASTGDGAYFSPGRGGVVMNVAGDLTNVCGPLETWFHEFGHMIDALAARRIGKGRFAKYSHERGFHETLQREIDGHVKGRWQALKAEVKSDEFKAWYARIDGGATVTADDVERAYRMGYLDGGYRKAKLRQIERGDSVTLKWSIPDIDQASKKAYAYQQLSNELKAMPDAAQSSLSDMFEAATKGKAKGRWGHGTSYWGSGGRHQATEGFAEFYSAVAISSETPEALATLREWLPESYDMFMDMMKEVAAL